jgi:hypothetical protein
MKPEESATLPVVRFSAGAGVRLAMEARQVAAMLAAPEPGTEVVTVETLLGLAPAEDGNRRWLRCAGRCLEVSEPVALASLSAAAIHPLPPLVAARLALRGVRALALEGDGVTLLL